MSIAVGFYTVKDLNDFLNLPLNVKYYEMDISQTLELFNKDYDEEVIREIMINPKMKEYIFQLFTQKLYKQESLVRIIILQEDLQGNLDLKFNGNVLEECIDLYNLDSKDVLKYKLNSLNIHIPILMDISTKNLITDYIAKCINSGKFVSDHYVNPILYITSFGFKATPLVTNLIPKLDNPSQYLKDEKGRTIEILKPFYKAAMSKELIDTSLGFRGSGLPSLAIENIASHAYDTSGMQLHEIMNIVSNITERPNPGVVGATADTFDNLDYIDV